MASFQFVSLLVLVSAILLGLFLNFRDTETQGVVFLSFRGRETRAGFTSHLFKALDEAGISTFINEVGARKKRNIDSEIERAIKDSKISIILFSEDYATSTFCLDELVLIMERRRTVGLQVLPLFYKVSTNEVEQQTGRYGQAFAEHEKKFIGEIRKVNQWRAALREVTGIVGKVYDDGWSEAEFIKEIVKIILNEPNYIAQVTKQERNDEFWADASYYFNLVIKFISIILGFVCFLLYLDYHYENRSKTTAYAFVATGGRDSEKFSSSLCRALIQSKIPIYRPFSALIRWGNKLSNLKKAINVSKMSIVVFSEDYASSTLCLNELVMIMERKREDKEYIVIPIFKDVNQDDVQQQTGAYANAFAEHGKNVNKKEVDTWRAALKEVVQTANEPVVHSIVRFHRPSIEDIVERIQIYREDQLDCDVVGTEQSNMDLPQLDEDQHQIDYVDGLADAFMD